ELAPMIRGGTNPTAAAVGTCQLVGGADGIPADVGESVTHFLLGMRSDEGGLRAHGRIPFADLLSTFTGSWTLAQLGALDKLEFVLIRAYARKLEIPAGGFKGHAWDDGHDVEYTFYGLGVLGLLGAG